MPPFVCQVRGDARRAERVVADPRADAGLQRAPAHHRVRIGLRPRRRAQLPGAARNRAKQRPIRSTGDAGAVEFSGGRL